jgi:hypothetical protein
MARAGAEGPRRAADRGRLSREPYRWTGRAAEPAPRLGATKGDARARRTGATGVLGLSGDYVGYVETPELVAQAAGESKRQYYGAALLERMGNAAQVASEAAGFTREP